MESLNLFTDKQLCIIGTGGCAREVYGYIVDIFKAENKHNDVVFLDKDKCVKDDMSVMGCKVIKESAFDTNKYVIVLGIGDSIIREKVVNKYPKETEYATIIHPTALISDWATIGKGAIITPNVVVNCNVTIGDFAHLNLQTNIGHDCKIGNFFTTAFSVNISGACTIGDGVYFGTNACVKQGVEICNNVIIGMGATVIKNIKFSGTYIGCPAKPLNCMWGGMDEPKYYNNTFVLHNENNVNYAA